MLQLNLLLFAWTEILILSQRVHSFSSIIPCLDLLNCTNNFKKTSNNWMILTMHKTHSIYSYLNSAELFFLCYQYVGNAYSLVITKLSLIIIIIEIINRQFCHALFTFIRTPPRDTYEHPTSECLCQLCIECICSNKLNL